MDSELEKFKKHINLSEFAAFCGYELDAKESGKSCSMMRHPDGDKIAITKNDVSKDWVYCSNRDNRDKGSIIDFLKWRGGGSLGEIRKTLRQFLRVDRAPIPSARFSPSLVPVSKDRGAAMTAWLEAQPCASLPYLTGRGIGPEVLGLPRFADCVRVDRRKNALFPHYDHLGLCGFEVKNIHFTGFSKGGEKGLWCSKASRSDQRLVFCESAIDAISHYVLNPDENARYMSIGGTLNPKKQPDLIRGAIEKMPPGSVVLLAFDNDEGGEKLAAEVQALAPAGVDLRRALPPVGMGKDWNEALKQSRGLGILAPSPAQYVFDPGYFGSVAHAPEGLASPEKGYNRRQAQNVPRPKE